MQIKSGVRTSEFYLSLIPIVLLFLSQIFNFDLDEGIITEGVLGVVSAITAGVYVHGRSKLKLEQLRSGSDE